MRNLAIIPARGGSKRIPQKNIKDFLGKPIINYSIEIALNSGLFDEVMVSTDDEEIAEISIEAGAKVPFLRSKKNSDDYAQTADVLTEVLELYHRNNTKVEYACCIYATSPLIEIRSLKQGFEKLVQHKFISVFPTVAYSYPIWRGLTLDSEECVKMVWPEYLLSRTQDLTKVYHDAGQWYWINVAKFNNLLFTDNSGTVILDENKIQDIDTLADWQLAELKYKMINGG